MIIHIISVVGISLLLFNQLLNSEHTTKYPPEFPGEIGINHFISCLWIFSSVLFYTPSRPLKSSNQRLLVVPRFRLKLHLKILTKLKVELGEKCSLWDAFTHTSDTHHTCSVINIAFCVLKYTIKLNWPEF